MEERKEENVQEVCVQEETAQVEKVKRKKKYWVAAIIVVVLVLAAAVGGYAANKWGKIKKTDLKKENLEVSKEVE